MLESTKDHTSWDLLNLDVPILSHLTDRHVV